MKAPKSYLDLLEGQAGIKERIEEIRIGNIAAEMRVYVRRPRITLMPGIIDEGELSFYSKDLLTNKRKEITLNFDSVVDSVRVLRDRMQSGEWDEEFALRSESPIYTDPIYVNTYRDDYVVIMSGRFSVEVDKALFLRLLEEYVEMIENRESGKVTVYFGREVVKEITS